MICGDTVEHKHWSDVDSQRLLSIVQQLLTQTFASAPCVTLLRDHESWLRTCVEEVQVQLSSTIRLLRSTLDLDFSLNPNPEQSCDPVTLMLLESKRKAFRMLVNLATADDTSSVCPSTSKNTATDAGTAPASPSPSKVSRPCTAIAAQAASCSALLLVTHSSVWSVKSILNLLTVHCCRVSRRGQQTLTRLKRSPRS